MGATNEGDWQDDTEITSCCSSAGARRGTGTKTWLHPRLGSVEGLMHPRIRPFLIVCGELP